MQDEHLSAGDSGAAKHEQLGEFGAIPGAPNGPPAENLSQSRKDAENGKSIENGQECSLQTPEIPTSEKLTPAPAVLCDSASLRESEKSEQKCAFSYSRREAHHESAPPSGPLQNLAFSSEAVEIHPAANIFPPMREKQFQELKESIAGPQGLREPIWTFEGRVIDGRHRLRACKETGVAPRFQEWDGKGSLLDFVISLNLHRRHLKEAQRAMVAARIKPQFEEEARQRLGHVPAVVAAQCKPARANLPARSGRSRDHAANSLSVSGRSVEAACKVLERGAPTLIAAVDACKLAVSTAAELCEFPHEEQTRLLAAGREEIAKKLKSIRGERKTTAKQSAAQAPALDPALEKKLINHFTNGWVKLTKTEQGFRMQFCDYYLDELTRAMNSQHFKTLMEHGVYMVKVNKDVA